MRCKSCRATIPAQRLKALPGTLHCANCSPVEPVGCVDIVYHKTGNTIQIMPKEQAQAINKSARRSGFGSLASMRGSGGSEKTGAYVHQVPLTRQATREDFNLAGERMMHFVELGMREKALGEITESHKSRLITPAQARQLKSIVDQFLPQEETHNI
jgi:hypothetical protein